MNILPKKRWHVRTKENIARVRRDEAEAAEKDRLEKLRIENADREARLNILKLKSKQKLLESGLDIAKNDTIAQSESSSQHINLFTDIDHAVRSTNKEHEKEAKEKIEEYEKKIGYLTYLGQDTNEALKKKNWYEVPPNSRFSRSTNVKDTYDKLVLKDQDGKPKHQEIDTHNGEVDWKLKQCHDPIRKFKTNCKYIESNLKTATASNIKIKDKSDKTEGEIKFTTYIKTKKKKAERDRNDKELKLQNLREARLKREQQEKYKTELFLSGINKPSTDFEKDASLNRNIIKPKYNSQFNPELARQNYRLNINK